MNIKMAGIAGAMIALAGSALSKLGHRQAPKSAETNNGKPWFSCAGRSRSGAFCRTLTQSADGRCRKCKAP